MHRSFLLPFLIVSAIVAVVWGYHSLAEAGSDSIIRACADERDGTLKLLKWGKCNRSQSLVTWNEQGPHGIQGVPGPKGDKGDKGDNGSSGISNYQVLFKTITVPAASSFSFSANCPEPRRAISGGYHFTFFNESLRIFSAGITSSAGNGFDLTGKNDENISREGTLYVVCADIASQLPSAIAP